MLTLVEHLIHLKTQGILSYFSLAYFDPQVFIQYHLKTEDNTLVIGSRCVLEDTVFNSVDDVLTELYSADDLVEVEVKSMG